jgi:hypothetical protein
MRFGISVLIASALLSSCSTASDESQPTPSKNETLIQPTPTCTSAEFTGGSNWIKGQLKAFGETDPEKAYSYASAEFRAANSLQDFAAVIVSQYAMLLDLKEYQVISCDKNGELFTFKVQLSDNQGSSYSMEYMLSLVNATWGVDAASVSLKIE